MINTLKLTAAQEDKLQKLQERWHIVSSPRPDFGWYNEKDGGAVTVTVGTENNPTYMLIGIETDGHSHS